jgi:gliding motility-associated-like protein
MYASACDIEVDAGPDTSICAPGGQLQLMGSVTGNAVWVQWLPPDDLNNPYILNPIADITGPITYTLVAHAPDPDAPELVVNGDFSSGNVGFDSDYNYVTDIPGNQTEMVPEGTYTVINNPNLVHTGFTACSDHTGGNGNMMVVNGAANFLDIWCQTVTVEDFQLYNVSAWLASVNPSSPAQIQFSINGTPIGTVVNALSTPCVWTPFNAIWNSENNTTAEICILNLNTALGGNDFALDDISMVALCAVTDEVEITIVEEEAPEPLIAGPEFVCEGDIATYIASFPPEPPIYEYQWIVPNNGTIISGQGTPEITIQWDEAGEVSLCLAIETRCEMNDACFDVTIGTVPELPFINGTSELCPGESEVFYTPEQGPDDTYDWTLPPNVTIISGQGTNEIEIEWALPGEAELCVAITNACGTTENCTAITLHESYFVLFDTLICEGSTFEINGNTYGNGVFTGTEYFLSVNGCDSVVEVEIMEASILLYQNTESLCPGDSVFLEGAFQTNAGIYIDSFVTASGCDSIIETTVLISAIDTTLLFSNTCDSTLDGIIVNTYSLGSCDSVVIETITYIPPDTLIMLGTSCNPADTGYTILILSNSYGCDSLIITDINLLPSDTTELFDTSCDPSDVGVITNLLTNQFGCDSLVISTTTFLLSDTTLIELIACSQNDTGTVQQLLENADGCDSLVITHTGYGGSDTTFVFNSSCNAADSGLVNLTLLNQYGCDSVVSTYTQHLLSDTTYLTARSCFANDTGLFIQQLTNLAGCDSTVYRYVGLMHPDSCGIGATYSIVSPPCYGEPAFLNIILNVGIPPYDLELIQGSSIETFSMDSKGTYDFTIPFEGEFVMRLRSENGYSLVDTLTYTSPAPLVISLETANDFNGYALACDGDANATIHTIVESGGTPPLEYDWAHGATSDTLFNIGEGDYTLTVTDANACMSESSIDITAPPAINYELIIDPIDCFGENNGSISITNVIGGVPPIMTSLNAMTFSNQLLFTGLDDGMYELLISDQNGCEFAETVDITEPADWGISLGPDTTIAYGTPFTLSTSLLGNPQGALRVEWSDGICDDCLIRTFAPTVQTGIGVTVTDENGCTATDQINIRITIDRELIVPNVFTPNGDNINDLIVISANPSVREIEWFRIYDRWGGLVFTADLFPPNDPQFGWDGYMNGELLNPAVFTYQLKAHYIDGFSEVRFGDITLLR